MSYITTLLLYNVFVFVCMLVCYKTGIQSKKPVLAFIFIALLSGLRYDIGNDYQIQAQQWDNIAYLFHAGFGLKELVLQNITEPMSLVLCFLFSWSKHPSAVIFFIYSILEVYFIYKVVRHNDCFISAIFILFTSCILFQMWDWTRQAVAMSIFLYSFQYIENAKLGKYLICILFAFLFHVSAIVLIPVYFVNKYDIGKYVTVCVILVLTALAYAGILEKMASLIIDTAGGLLYEGYVGSSHSVQSKNVSGSLLLFFNVAIVIVQLLNIPKDRKILRTMLTLGAILYTLSTGNLLVDRIAAYFLLFQLISFQYVFKVKSMALVTSVLMLFYYNYSIINIGGTRGAVPYDSVFSENFEKGIFRYRKFL